MKKRSGTKALPTSKAPVLDRAGIDNVGYLNSKGTPSGEGAKFNKMPPGMDIEDQEVSDIRSMPEREVTGLSYPGDGWE